MMNLEKSDFSVMLKTSLKGLNVNMNALNNQMKDNHIILEYENKLKSLREDEMVIKSQLKKIDTDFREFGPSSNTSNNHHHNNYNNRQQQQQHAANAPHAPSSTNSQFQQNKKQSKQTKRLYLIMLYQQKTTKHIRN